MLYKDVYKEIKYEKLAAQSIPLMDAETQGRFWQLNPFWEITCLSFKISLPSYCLIYIALGVPYPFLIHGEDELGKGTTWKVQEEKAESKR